MAPAVAGNERDADAVEFPDGHDGAGVAERRGDRNLAQAGEAVHAVETGAAEYAHLDRGAVEEGR